MAGVYAIGLLASQGRLISTVPRYQSICSQRIHLLTRINPWAPVVSSPCVWYSTTINKVKLENQKQIVKKTKPKVHELMGTTDNNFKHKMSKNEVTFAKKIQFISSINSLLDLNKDRKLQVDEASLVIERLGQLCEIQAEITDEDIEKLLGDHRFEKIGGIVHNRASVLSTPVLLNCLQCLLKLSKKDVLIIESLERQVTWLLNKMPIGQVFRVLLMHKDHQETTLRQNMYVSALTTIEKRWVEISNPKDLVTIMYINYTKGQKNLLGRLEEKALDLCESMSLKDLYRVLYIQARLGRRNKPLIKAIFYHLNKRELDLSPVHLTNLVYACACVNMIDTNLMDQVTTSVLTNIDQFRNINLLSSLLKSFSLLRWCDIPLLEALSRKLLEQYFNGANEITRIEDLCRLLLSCATLNYLPMQVKEQLPKIRDALRQSKDVSAKSLVDSVWSLGVLGIIDTPSTELVLSPKFVKRVEGEHGVESANIKLKLLNVNAAAEHDLQGYAGPKLDSDLVQHISVKIPIKTNRPTLTEVMTALNKLAPSEKYMNRDVPTPYGYLIDIELLINEKGEPQPLVEYETVFPWQQGGSKSIPDQYYRVATKVLEFSDMTLSSVHPTGLHSLEQRHLSKLGYHIVQIPYTEFNQLSSQVKKVQYIQSKLKQVIDKKDQENRTEMK